jgi:hypothetical protein
VGKDSARKAFDKRRVSEELLAQMLSAIEAQKRSAQWKRDSGQFIPHPTTWLNEGRWQDGEASSAKWWLTAGFADQFEAENAKCFAHNAAQFRDGRRVTEPA